MQTRTWGETLRVEEEGHENHVDGNGRKIFAQHPLKQQCCICTTLVEISPNHLGTTFGKQSVPILGTD